MSQTCDPTCTECSAAEAMHSTCKETGPIAGPPSKRCRKRSAPPALLEPLGDVAGTLPLDHQLRGIAPHLHMAPYRSPPSIFALKILVRKLRTKRPATKITNCGNFEKQRMGQAHSLRATPRGTDHNRGCTAGVPLHGNQTTRTVPHTALCLPQRLPDRARFPQCRGCMA